MVYIFVFGGMRFFVAVNAIEVKARSLRTAARSFLKSPDFVECVSLSIRVSLQFVMSAVRTKLCFRCFVFLDMFAFIILVAI
jgi:hypothetical protein